MTLKIQILSDVHLEFDSDRGEAFVHEVPVIGDVLVLAGDLTPLHDAAHVHQTFRWFCSRFPHVVFVPGNHEYYGIRPVDAEDLLVGSVREIPNLHVLNPGAILIEATRFVGATLWFPDTPDEVLYRGRLADFQQIKNFVPWVHTTHTEHLDFLKTRVQPQDVVITHHLPHPRSIAPQHAGSSLNRFFVAEDAAALVERSEARLWIHGHTHASCDYVIGKTRVVCNPRGYPHEANDGFDPGLVVEI